MYKSPNESCVIHKCVMWIYIGLYMYIIYKAILIFTWSFFCYVLMTSYVLWRNLLLIYDSSRISIKVLIKNLSSMLLTAMKWLQLEILSQNILHKIIKITIKIIIKKSREIIKLIQCNYRMRNSLKQFKVN